MCLRCEKSVTFAAQLKLAQQGMLGFGGTGALLVVNQTCIFSDQGIRGECLKLYGVSTRSGGDFNHLQSPINITVVVDASFGNQENRVRHSHLPSPMPECIGTL